MHLTVKRRAGFAEVTLNRPERLNALSHELVADLRTLLSELDRDPGVRAIVLTGAGRAFCAGADLRAGPSDAEDVLRRLYNPLTIDMTSMDTPLVAAINGAAVGAGCSLALACDLRIAAANATFQMPFAKIGLVPDAGSTWLLPRAVGATRATEIALLGRRIAAEDALAWNLVNEVVTAERLAERAGEIAAELAGLSASVAATRRLLHSGWGADLPAHLDAEATAQGAAQHHPHYAEARRAFREKRPPAFAWDAPTTHRPLVGEIGDRIR